MTGEQLRQLRLRMGLSLAEFARALGYTGSPRNERRRIDRLEALDGRIPEAVQLRVAALELEQAVQYCKRRGIVR